MLQGKTKMAEVISMAQVFRLDKGRWPAHAAELLAFSRTFGGGLDLSGFHMLILRIEGEWSLSLEYALLVEGEKLALCGRIGLVRVALTDQETTFQWLTRHEALPSKKVETGSYCFIG